MSDNAVLTPIQKANARMKELRDSGQLVIERLDPVESARRNPHSKQKAIRAHCWQCMGAGADPGTKQSVRDCGVKDCALWPHRPWQNVLGKSSDQMTDEEFSEAYHDGDTGADTDDGDDD